MILKFDGLDTLWEDNINWNTLNPVGGDNEHENNSEEEDNEEDNSIYVATHHDENSFVPVFAHNLIDSSDVHAYETIDDEKLQHDMLKRLLSNHLQIMYRTGKLRWPKYRKEVEDSYRVNNLIRENLPGLGDLL